MASLTQLDPAKHGSLKVIPNCAINVVKDQHVISLRVIEVIKAVCDFPIFFTKMDGRDEWAISAITNLELNSNLFVGKDSWQASYLPYSMQTYPLFLMRDEEDDSQVVIGIDEAGPSFSNEEGEALYDDEGNATILHSKLKSQLEECIKHDVHTFQFAQKLQELGLIKPIEILVHYHGGRINKLNGLQTIDEDRLQQLDEAAHKELRELGYIAPIYAMLMSIYQLNGLLRKHNKVHPDTTVANVSLQSPRDENA